MSYREIVEEASRLSLHEQLRLVEESMRNLRLSEERANKPRRRRVKPMSELRGALKTAGEPPTDAELRDIYTDHLVEKHL